MKLWHEVFQNFSLTTLLPGAVRLRGLRTWRDGVRVVLRGQVARRDRPQRVAERDGAGEPPAAVHARGDVLRPLVRGHDPQHYPYAFRALSNQTLPPAAA